MATNKKRLSREREELNRSRARWQRRKEARNLRCRSEIRKHPRWGVETPFTLTLEQSVAWRRYYVNRRSVAA